jgi:hypothetical protein
MITITTDLTALNLAAAADLRTARGLTADGAQAPPVAAPRRQLTPHLRRARVKACGGRD